MQSEKLAVILHFCFLLFFMDCIMIVSITQQLSFSGKSSQKYPTRHFTITHLLLILRFCFAILGIIRAKELLAKYAKLIKIVKKSIKFTTRKLTQTISLNQQEASDWLNAEKDKRWGVCKQNSWLITVIHISILHQFRYGTSIDES